MWKRSLDLLISVVALVVLSPLLLAIAMCVRFTLGKPALFRQQRPGIGGELFTLFKFRTMRESRGDQAMADLKRVTGVGSFLRRSSLDELPELWNVLRGDMSLVGPRPLLVQYLNRYTVDQRRRHEVLPGITGLAQVCGRNAITWSERFALDVWYVDHQSPWLDAKILLLTMGKVLWRQGINWREDTSMPEFLGSAEPID